MLLYFDGATQYRWWGYTTRMLGRGDLSWGYVTWGDTTYILEAEQLNDVEKGKFQILSCSPESLYQESETDNWSWTWEKCKDTTRCFSKRVCCSKYFDITHTWTLRRQHAFCQWNWWLGVKRLLCRLWTCRQALQLSWAIKCCTCWWKLLILNAIHWLLLIYYSSKPLI